MYLTWLSQQHPDYLDVRVSGAQVDGDVEIAKKKILIKGIYEYKIKSEHLDFFDNFFSNLDSVDATNDWR